MSSRTPRHVKTSRGKTLREKINDTRGEAFDFAQSLASTEERDGFHMEDMECELPRCSNVNTVEINPSVIEIEGAGALELASAHTASSKRNRETVSQTDTSITLKKGGFVPVDEFIEILTRLFNLMPESCEQIKFQSDESNWTIHFPGAPNSPEYKKPKNVPTPQCPPANPDASTQSGLIDPKNVKYISMLEEGVKCSPRSGSSKVIVLGFNTIKMSKSEVERKYQFAPPAESFVKFLLSLVEDKPQIKKALSLYTLPAC